MCSLMARADDHPAIVRNDLSDLSTTAIVSFNGPERVIGENAMGRVRIRSFVRLFVPTLIRDRYLMHLGQIVAAPSSTIPHASMLLWETVEEAQRRLPGVVVTGTGKDGEIQVEVPYDGSTHEFAAKQIAAMLMGRVRTFCSGEAKVDMNDDDAAIVLTVRVVSGCLFALTNHSMHQVDPNGRWSS